MKGRCVVRHETGSTPTATRISQSLGLRSRMVPLPHAMRARAGDVTRIPGLRISNLSELDLRLGTNLLIPTANLAK